MRLLPTALLLVGLLGVTACSDDDSEPVAAPETQTVTETETVTVTAEPTAAPEPPPPPPSTLEPEPALDTPPTTYDEAQARFDALGQEPQDVARFETADGTYCLLDSDFAIGCELLGGIPDPAYCGEGGASQSVGRVVLTEGGPQPECNSDTIREPGAPTVGLDSVAASSVTGVQCLVEAIGVTCVDPARTQGFFLGPDAYAVFTAG